MLHNTVSFSMEMYLFVSASDERRHVDRSKMAEASTSLELAHVVSTYRYLSMSMAMTNLYFRIFDAN